MNVAIENLMNQAYTSTLGGNMPIETKGNPTLEKYELLQKLVKGNASSEQIGHKLRAIDDKYRTKRAIMIAKVAGVLALLLSPFLIPHPSTTSD